VSTEVQFIFVLLAIICWVIAAFTIKTPPWWWAALIPLGLALATFPHLWDLAKAL
jgi:hypothetical protein